jgi:chromatin segregation and condensation protein Rec8/ScpA/Scc1 (kleisin family)
MVLRKTLSIAEKPISALGIFSPPPLQVDFPKFSGSLAQLFSRVREHRIALLDIPLLPICEAYFRYLLEGENPNLEEGAAALGALSYLLERKAWMLLPVPDQPSPEEDVLELAEISIHEYFEAVDYLREAFTLRSQLFFRTSGPAIDAYELPFVLEELQVSALATALKNVLERRQEPVLDRVTRSGRSLAFEMGMVLDRVSSQWGSFESLLLDDGSREDAVYVFLSLLELIRTGRVQSRLIQDRIEFSQA